jgi:hypothetical protein
VLKTRNTRDFAGEIYFKTVVWQIETRDDNFNMDFGGIFL